MKKMEFDYFSGMEAEQYSFYRIPKMLFTEGCFKQLSCEAKVLYGLLLDRMGLSIKNRWIDEKNRVFIMFTVEDIMELLNCGKQKAVRCLAELDSEKGIGLVEKKRLGLGRPNVIYVKNFMQKGGSDQKPEYSPGHESRQEPENSPEKADSRKIWNHAGCKDAGEPGHKNEEGDRAAGQPENSGCRQIRLNQGPADPETEKKETVRPDLQGNDIQISESIKTKLQESMETGQESGELNWWDMESMHQGEALPDSARQGSRAVKIMPELSVEMSEMAEGGRDAGGAVLDIYTFENTGMEKAAEYAENSQKYENHTSRSSKIILQEVPESYSGERGIPASGDMSVKKAAEYAQNSQKYENHTSRSSKIILQEVPESYFKGYENHTSGSSRIILQEVPKSYPNDTEYSETENNDTEMNKTEKSETDLSDTYTGLCDPVQSYQSYQSYQSNPASLSAGGKTAGLTDMEDKMDGYRSIIRDNIGYHCFEVDRYYSIEDVDEFVELMVEVMAMPDGSSLRVSGAERPVSVVKSRFMKINKEHIEYVLGCLQNNTTKIGNIKAYLLTALYNATLTISNYYRAEVNHDMYGGAWNG